MNIFVTDPSPYISAINLDDKRIRHMPRECIELLGMVIYDLKGVFPFKVPLFNEEERSYRFMDELYNHPCSKWARRDIANSWWLFRHTLFLINEYYYRNNVIHPNIIYYQRLIRYIPDYIKPTNVEPKSFQNSSLFQFNEYKDVFKSYRETMNVKWFETDFTEPTWNKRDKPKWAIKKQEQQRINFHIKNKQPILFNSKVNDEVDNYDDLPF